MLLKPFAALSAGILITACGKKPPTSALHDAPEPDYCAGVETLTRPMLPNSEQTFAYSYRVLERDAAAPTIVFLPGGPGDTSIDGGTSPGYVDLLFPKNYNLIFTDPRGIGCNPVGAPPGGFFTTENLASDVLAIIESRKLKDYYIFGWSYGTELGTVVAAQAEAAGMAPRAVVLEGVLGKHFGEQFGTYDGFTVEWEKLKAKLAPTVVAKLSQSPMPLGLSESQWAAFINQGNMIQMPGSQTIAEKLAFLDSTDDEALAQLKESVIQTADGFLGVAPELKELYPALLCSELAQSDNTDMALINGKIIGHQDPEICAGRPLIRPWDSADHQIHSPIYYVQGDSDPATTLANARYHYDNQNTGKKALITVPGASHYAFGPLQDCFAGFWDSVKNAGQGLSETLAGCAVKPKIDMKG